MKETMKAVAFFAIVAIVFFGLTMLGMPWTRFKLTGAVGPMSIGDRAAWAAGFWMIIGALSILAVVLTLKAKRDEASQDTSWHRIAPGVFQRKVGNRTETRHF